MKVLTIIIASLQNLIFLENKTCKSDRKYIIRKNKFEKYRNFDCNCEK